MTSSSANKASVPSSAGNVRLPQLDLLRGIAIIMVLIHHGILPTNKAGWLNAGWLTPVASFFWRFGWTGVDLFFVLSGFLIGSLLFNEIITRGSLDVWRFAIRRGFKIWPAYFALVFYCMIMWVHQHHSISDAFHTFWPNLLHIQNYRMTPAGHTWSLAVEEHFYIALPLLILLLRSIFPGSRDVPFFLPVALAAFAICLSLRLHSRWDAPYTFQQHLFPTHLRIDSLFFGVLLAWFCHFRPHWRPIAVRYRGVLFVAGVAMLVPMMILTREDTFFVSTFGFTFLALGYSLILLAAIHTSPGIGWAGKLIDCNPAAVISYVGLYSFSIYLWHLDLMRERVRHWTYLVFDRQGPELRYVLYTGTYVIVAIISGILMAKLIETPSLKLRDRLFPARATATGNSLPLARVACSAGTASAELEPVAVQWL